MKFNKELVKALVAFTLTILNVNFVAGASAADAPPSKPKSTEPVSYPTTLLQKIGITSTRTLSNEENAKLKIKNGLMLETVVGKAAISGVQPGDILLSINGRDTRFGKIEKLPDDFPTIIVLLVLRADDRLPIAVQLPPLQRSLFVK